MIPARLRGGDARGQILPLFALLLVVLCGFAALAIDVSSAYSARRTYRSIADAAALAGAQDLYETGTRLIGTASYAKARADALASVRAQLGGTYSCGADGTVRVCQLAAPDGATYRVAVRSPLAAGTCESCDPIRSVGVDVARPAFPLSFARVLGFDDVAVGAKAVAGLRIKKSYTIVTLRPPDSSRTADNQAIKFGGTSTVVRVVSGDVASNGNMSYNGGDEQLELDAGFDFDYYDPYRVGPQWTTVRGTAPAGAVLAEPIQTPDWTIPVRPGTYPSPAPLTPATSALCKGEVDYLRGSANYGSYLPATVTDAQIQCWLPGSYPGGPIIGGQDVVVLLSGLGTPNATVNGGVFFFPGGLTVKGGLIGGYRPNDPGVALVFGPDQPFSNSTDTRFPTDLIALNAGSRNLATGTGGTEAAPARYGTLFGGGLRNKPIENEAGRPLTILVAGSGACTVANHANCSSSKVMKLTGGAAIYLAGVQYAPEDDAQVSGKSGSAGFIGQIWSWTLTYVGNSTIYQGGADAARPGSVRLDAACSSSATRCPTF